MKIQQQKENKGRPSRYPINLAVAKVVEVEVMNCWLRLETKLAILL